MKISQVFTLMTLLMIPDDLIAEKITKGKEIKRMTPTHMLDIIREVGKNVAINNNVVEFEHLDVKVILVYDQKADRMRLISPIAKIAEVNKEDLIKVMEANFHSALDARYSMSNGLVWSAFIHPLSDLSDKLMTSEISQVANAAKNFGTSFSSGDLVFSGH